MTVVVPAGVVVVRVEVETVLLLGPVWLARGPDEVPHGRQTGGPQPGTFRLEVRPSSPPVSPLHPGTQQVLGQRPQLRLSLNLHWKYQSLPAQLSSNFPRWAK